MNILNEVYKDMENKVYDFTKQGECSGCGQCCSALLPLSAAEVKTIKEYVKDNNIKPHKHGNVFAEEMLDLTCPFLDNRKKYKCDIYPARPKICRTFICNQPPSTIKENKERFWATRQPIYMWDIVEGDDDDSSGINNRASEDTK